MKILEALGNINAELGVIEKDQKGHGYMFRGINQVMNALKPLVAKYKVLVKRENVKVAYKTFDVETPSYKEGEPPKKKTIFRTELECDYVFVSCEDGSEFRTRGFGEAVDNASFSDKSTAMAISNTYKYVIFELFNIAVEEQADSDQDTADKKEKESKFAKPDDAPKTKFSQIKPETVEPQKEKPKESPPPVEKPQETKVESPPVEKNEVSAEVKQNVEQKKSRFAR